MAETEINSKPKVSPIKSTSDLANPLPLLPLRDIVIYPHMVIPLFVGRKRSVLALEEAAASNKQILLVAQKEPNVDEPAQEDFYHIGTVSNILQLLKLPDGTIKVLVEGIKRGKVNDFVQNEPFCLVDVELVDDEKLNDVELEALIRSALSQFEQYVNLNKKIPSEIVASLQGVEEPVRLIDTMAAHMGIKIESKQKILEATDLNERIKQLLKIISSEIELLQVESKIKTNVKKQMEKNQKEYYLTEQMKAIQKELGNIREGGESVDEVTELEEKIKSAKMSTEAFEKASAELKKYKMMSPMAAEATVCRNYIDWMINVPWHKKTKKNISLNDAESTLEQDHYGLDKVKERILEYLAVQKRVKKLKGPILCLVGPPGVGKTSLGRSIARATGRKFVRMSLGGMRDESEIRGHRRTYIGALPGKILQKLAKVKVKNPLFLLDEIDKMAMDFRGDPASALLEVLDPEQNKTFNDHYLEVDYDLSDVMFIATANSMNIPAPLLDRMEVIRIAGYTEDEKLAIAKNYLIPKEIEQNGLKKDEISIDDEAILDVIRYYTREAGVRNLDREVSKICRKVVKQILTEKELKTTKFNVDSSNLEELLGVKKFRFGVKEEIDRVGQVTGLAWTEVGGEILTIEASVVPGKGQIIKTGKLGDVMQESIQAALTVVRARSEKLKFDSSFYDKSDIHVHVPEGATPKDGPSAGIGMCTALVSVLTNIPVKKEIAMTGEITLRGQVLPIGGLKEKLLAAKRAGIEEVIIPEENMRDLKEIPDTIYQGVKIHPVKIIDEVLDLALTKKIL